LKRFIKRSFDFVYFISFVAYEIILASLRVAVDVLTPGLRAEPALLAFPLECQSDIQITVLANVISMTPGTLSLHVSEDKKLLILHVMYFYEKEAFIADLKRKFEKPIREIWR